MSQSPEIDTQVLQAVRLKGGMADQAMVAAAAGRTEAASKAAIDALVAAEAIEDSRGRYRITAAGRDAVERALAVERDRLSTAGLDSIYRAFTVVNASFKQLVTDWQTRDGEPNDHDDPHYDYAVISRLEGLHARFIPLSERITEAVPRLEPYPERLSSALERLRAGEARYFASPLVDSYHQVWFELHEELICLLGRDRSQEEAAEGRAA